jgi:3-deoxy-manno-octulosonate cytidylyltransferase (CMP-KDO synthetase)
MDRFIGIIPARFKSTRFPGKPLADIKGKAMILRVYERVSEVLDDVVVATDDNRILDLIHESGGNAVMTSESHQSGTDRCFEALKTFEKQSGELFDVVINVQGDEPFIRPDQISLLKDCFNKPSVEIATLIKEVEDQAIIFDPNRPKVVVNNLKEALLFSRSPIPYFRGQPEEQWLKAHKYFQHIGMYAYRSKVLAEITKLDQGGLELAESLEQLRWLENGYKIQTAITKFESYGIDTPEDLERALKMDLL